MKTRPFYFYLWHYLFFCYFESSQGRDMKRKSVQAWWQFGRCKGPKCREFSPPNSSKSWGLKCLVVNNGKTYDGECLEEFVASDKCCNFECWRGRAELQSVWAAAKEASWDAPGTLWKQGDSPGFHRLWRMLNFCLSFLWLGRNSGPLVANMENTALELLRTVSSANWTKKHFLKVVLCLCLSRGEQLILLTPG